MNERIKELEDQCWEDIPVDIDYDYLSRVRRVFNREKFAELIVRECLTVINQPNGVGDDDVIRISEDVKKHFGVES